MEEEPQQVQLFGNLKGGKANEECMKDQAEHERDTSFQKCLKC